MEAPKLLKRRKMVRTGREIAGQRAIANHEIACKRAATKTMKRQVSLIIFAPVRNSSSAEKSVHFWSLESTASNFIVLKLQKCP